MLTVESLTVILIVGLACVAAIWKLIRILKDTGGCCGDCAGSCPLSDIFQDQKEQNYDETL